MSVNPFMLADGSIGTCIADTLNFSGNRKCWVAYYVGQKTVGLDGDFTAAELRDFFVMLEPDGPKTAPEVKAQVRVAELESAIRETVHKLKGWDGSDVFAIGEELEKALARG